MLNGICCILVREDSDSGLTCTGLSVSRWVAEYLKTLYIYIFDQIIHKRCCMEDLWCALDNAVHVVLVLRDASKTTSALEAYSFINSEVWTEM